ncbi:MAG: FAD:protein FMN transferase [Candidatus Bathyarchaeia archaeon]
MSKDSSRLNRRDVLRLACLAGLTLAIPLLRLSATNNSGNAPSVFRRSIKALGTTVTITVEDELGPVKLQAATEDAFNEIRRLELQLTRFQSTSPVSHLNQMGRVETPARELFDALHIAEYFYDRTEGVFDITVKPVLDLLESYRGSSSLPSEVEFDAAKRLVDFQSLSISKDALTLAKPKMGITLDCIGKGYVLDKAAERLRAYGISSALIQGGGTVVAIGSRSDGSPWRIGVRDPLDLDALIGRIDITNAAVATSGDYEDFFSEDGHLFHIVNPATARSPLYSHSATVMASTATEADPLALTLMVKDPREGLRLLGNFHGCECLIATRDEGYVQSGGFQGEVE